MNRVRPDEEAELQAVTGQELHGMDDLPGLTGSARDGDTLTDSSLPVGLWYSLPIRAVGSGLNQRVMVFLLVGAERFYLPAVSKSAAE